MAERRQKTFVHFARDETADPFSTSGRLICDEALLSHLEVVQHLLEVRLRQCMRWNTHVPANRLQQCFCCAVCAVARTSACLDHWKFAKSLLWTIWRSSPWYFNACSTLPFKTRSPCLKVKPGDCVTSFLQSKRFFFSLCFSKADAF